MEYVYDIVLNFHNDYYDFYEWEIGDKIINVKRIGIYKIRNDDYLNIMNNDVLIDMNSLPGNNKMFLLTNGLEVMGISNEGNKKSSLLIDEADEILEDNKNLKITKIKYKIVRERKKRSVSRSMEEKINYINKYLHDNKDRYLLKYLYYEIFEIDMDDMKKIYNDLYDLVKKDTMKIYEAIQRVNLELKK